MGNSLLVLGSANDDDDDEHDDELVNNDDHTDDMYHHHSMTTTTTPSTASWHNFPLHHAAACGAPVAELARLVEQGNNDVDEIHDESGSTPLHFAALYGQESAVRWLLKQRRMLGRHHAVRDFHGRTAAELAKQSGFTDLAAVIDFHHQPPPASTSSVASASSSGDAPNAQLLRPRLLHKHHSSVGNSNNNDSVQQLLQELDRANSAIAKLKASEKRVRYELEQEVAERIKLFRSLVVKSHQQQADAFVVDVAETMSDLRLQVVEFKAQRDALAAELKLVEAAVGNLELYVTGTNETASDASSSAAPSERLKSCLRRI